MLTQLAYRHYGDAVKDVMPALGSHEPLTEVERERMFEIVPAELFRVHDWRNDVVTVGETASSALGVTAPRVLRKIIAVVSEKKGYTLTCALDRLKTTIQ